eukprot:COSAG04_NODE_2087_length_4828_cov_15.357418_5_plen_175_part_00
MRPALGAALFAATLVGRAAAPGPSLRAASTAELLEELRRREAEELGFAPESLPVASAERPYRVTTASGPPPPSPFAEHSNFICARSWGEGSYPLPCPRANRDLWRQPFFRDNFIITGWGGPEIRFRNGSWWNYTRCATSFPPSTPHSWNGAAHFAAGATSWRRSRRPTSISCRG